MGHKHLSTRKTILDTNKNNSAIIVKELLKAEWCTSDKTENPLRPQAQMKGISIHRFFTDLTRYAQKD